MFRKYENIDKNSKKNDSKRIKSLKMVTKRSWIAYVVLLYDG